MSAGATSFDSDRHGLIRVLLVSGSLRGRSTNTSVLRTAEVSAPEGVHAAVYDGLGDLPHFNPDDDVIPLHPAVATLRSAIRRADALLFSTPEYAGALPGSFKNLLDWTIGDGEVGSISEKPVAWINASPRRAELAHESLRAVLGYANAALVEPACTHVPVTGAMVGEDGLIADPEVRSQIAGALTALATAAHRPTA
jgi:chromate reductase, NAD(P)H dehydrogenase (quinone)